MKKSLLRNSLNFLAISFLFIACQKEAVNDSSRIAAQPDGAAELRTSTQSSINESAKSIAAFGKDFNNTLSQAGMDKNSLAGLSIYQLTKLPVFSALNAAVNKTGLTATLSTPGLNATVFAPTDAAFAQLPWPFNNAQNINNITDADQISALKNILLYHVLGTEVKSSEIPAGRSNAVTLKPAGNTNDNTIYFSNGYGLIAINGATLVVFANVPASNGIVHIINKVLMPPAQTIAEIAIANPAFTALVAALVKTDLAGVFQAAGDYTVFAPTDDAFAQLPEPFNNAVNIAAITDQAQIDALANILKYHVLADRYFTLDLGVTDPLTTIAQAPNNQLIGLRAINKGYVKGNQNPSFAKASPANILATNGVVHVIDQVLLP
jgi:transforming growth factor-beta-induced protein